MKIFFQKTYLFLCIFASLFVLNACKDKTEQPTEVSNVNRFINDCFEVFYLWNDKLPNVNVKTETDSYAFFNKMKYRDDYWSSLTNDVRAMEESFSGEETTFGYSLVFYYSELAESYFGVVRYVHSDSPAANAGLKRGDLILKVNGEGITESNYLNLYYAPSLSLELGKYENGTTNLTGETVLMNAVKAYMNPIITYKIIEKATQKIGYLHYSDYLLKSHQDLKTVFSEFIAANVSEIILDLRYNGGGYSITSKFLCSMLLSQDKLNGRNIYLKEIWNSDYMSYFEREGNDMNEYFSNPIGYRDVDGKDVSETIDINFEGLQKIYILTGSGTASASEATIVGLMPYMNDGVVLIGDTTHGKFCGGSILSPGVIYQTTGGGKKWFDDIRNWGAYIMLYRYSNANSYPNHTNGLAPDYLVEEDILRNPYALGDENEPLLAKAIELITGISSTDAVLKTMPLPTTYRPANELKTPLKALDGKMIDDKFGLFQPLIIR